MLACAVWPMKLRSGDCKLPWTPHQAIKHNKAAKLKGLQHQWSDVANSVLQRTGDDAQAIRTANGVLKKERAAGTKVRVRHP